MAGTGHSPSRLRGSSACVGGARKSPRGRLETAQRALKPRRTLGRVLRSPGDGLHGRAVGESGAPACGTQARSAARPRRRLDTQSRGRIRRPHPNCVFPRVSSLSLFFESLFFFFFFLLFFYFGTYGAAIGEIILRRGDRPTARSNRPDAACAALRCLGERDEGGRGQHRRYVRTPRSAVPFPASWDAIGQATHFIRRAGLHFGPPLAARALAASRRRRRSQIRGSHCLRWDARTHMCRRSTSQTATCIAAVVSGARSVCHLSHSYRRRTLAETN